MRLSRLEWALCADVWASCEFVGVVHIFWSCARVWGLCPCVGIVCVWMYLHLAVCVRLSVTVRLYMSVCMSLYDRYRKKQNQSETEGVGVIRRTDRSASIYNRFVASKN